MREVRQEDSRFLGGQPLLTPSVPLQAPFLGFQLGFDCGEVVSRLCLYVPCAVFHFNTAVWVRRS